MPVSEAAILVVDSDDAARAAAEEALRRQGFDVQSCGSADQGLGLAATLAFQVVVLGDRYSVLDAAGWLRQLSQRGIDTAVVVTGAPQTGSDRLFELLRAGAVEFLRKPLTAEPLVAAVHRAVTIVARRAKEGAPRHWGLASDPGRSAAASDPGLGRRPPMLPDALNAIDEGLAARTIEIPAVPTIVGDLRRATRDPRTSLDDVARLIQRDQSLSLDVLKIANSTAYLRGSRTSDIKTALGRIGLKQVDALIETVFLRGFYRPHSKAHKDLLRSVWRYSVASAIAMRLLTENHGRATRLDPGVAYAAGLFRDVGASFLVWVISERTPALAMESFLPFVRLRHEAIGGQILATWGLDAAIPQVAATHHGQSPPTGTSLYWSLAAVATELADAAVPGGDPTRGVQRATTFVGACADSLHISEGMLRRVFDRLVSELDGILNALE